MSRLQVDQYDRLSDRVHLYRPKSTGSETILLLCLFMDAPPKLITRYATDYRTHFPESTIILILSDWRSAFTRAAKSAADLDPAIDYVLGHRDATIKGAVYSNGGISTLTTLAKAYRSKTSSVLNVESMVIDSAPATENDLVAHKAAFSALVPPSLRGFPLGLVFDALLWLMMGTWFILAKATGGGDPVCVFRADINDPTLLVPGRRTYIYSKRDEVSRWTGVESSARDAGERGWTVKLVEFQGTRHVAHVVGDKAKYWRTVEETFK